MPQMKPMNWMFLYITLILTIMFMNIMNYFFYYNNLNNNILKKNKKNFNWKW